MTATIPSTALATVQPVFTDSERLALAGFLAGYRGRPARPTPWTCASSPPGATPGPCTYAPVGGDLVQPGAQQGAFLGEPADALPGGQHCLLDDVLGVLEGSEHPSIR